MSRSDRSPQQARFFSGLLLGWLLVWLPSLVLLVTVVSLVIDIVRLNTVRSDAVHLDVAKFLEEREATVVPFPEEYEALGNSTRNILVFGGSSVVISDGETFSTYLGRRLRKTVANVRVVNLGVNAIDSFSLKVRVLASLSGLKGRGDPALIVIYAGHNDYTNPYQFVVTPAYQAFRWELKLIRFLFSRDESWFWFVRERTPPLLYALQVSGAVRFDDLDYTATNDLILRHFQQNLSAILVAAADRHIPVVLITPIGNLYAQPYGALDATHAYYDMGLESERYEERLHYLMAARDSEIFTLSIRAKSRLIDYLRALNSEGVYVFDLESKLIEERFQFGNSDFLDYFHLNDRTHRLVADRLAEFMLSRAEISSALGGD